MRAAGAQFGCLLEELEARTLLSMFTVTTTHDFGVGSLRQAVLDANDAAGADVIEFDASLGGQTIALLYGELLISDHLTISGPGSGQLTIDAATRSRVLCTEADAAISGLTLTRGSTGANGGAICSGVGRSLTLRDVAVVECTAQYSGGGIAVGDGGRLTLDDVRVVACVADLWVGLGGGGIYAGPGSSVEIEGAGAVIRNGAGIQGGGLYLGVASTLSAERLTILENSASSGGAIYAAAQSTITLSEGGLLRNVAQWGGAVQLSDGSFLSLNGVTVSENNAAETGGGVLVDGGARLAVSDSLFEYNGSAHFGGAIHAGRGATVTLTGTTVAHNRAVKDGGGIFLDAAALTVTGSSISENAAGSKGGGLAAVVGADFLLIEDTTFASNSAARGGGFSFSGDAGSSAELRMTTVTGNVAGTGGGGAADMGSILLVGCTIASNTADTGGGVHFAGSNATLRSTVIQWNSAITGGGVHSNAEQLTVERSTIGSNNASGNGGGLHLGSGVLRMQDSTVGGNGADWLGGGVALVGGTAHIGGSAIVGNAARNGGGIYVNVDTQIDNSTIAGNSARSMGGGIYIESPVIGAIVSSTIVQNHATGFFTSNPDEAGGGIFNQWGHFLLQSTILARNTAGTGVPSDYFGHLLHPESSCDLIGDVVNTGGLTDGQNGNIVGADPLLGVSGNYGGPTLTYSLLPNSPALDAGSNPLGLSADQRGARFRRASGPPDIGAFEVQSLALVVDSAEDLSDDNYEPGRLSLREAIALSNANPEADSITFDISLRDVTITLGGTELTVTDSVSVTGPGADMLVIDAAGASRHFSIDDGDAGRLIAVSISGLHLRNGSVPGNGGAIDNKENLTLHHLRLTGNFTGHDGGAVHSRYGSLQILDSTITGNTARIGGGFAISGVATIDRCSIYQNSAGGGGGIAVSGGELTLRNSTISANTASTAYAGGVLVVAGGTAALLNSTICGNEGPDAGGIFVDGLGVLLRSTIVAGNTANGLPSDIGNGAVSGTNNLIGDARTSGGLTKGVGDNIVGADPLLADLADNGGPTLTHALLPGSPAIDAGSNPERLASDQRGRPRARGEAPDIGAFEANIRPTIGAIDAAAAEIVQGSSLLLHAFDAADSDGSVVSVRYWADLDGDGNADELLGASSTPGNGFAFTVPGALSRTFPLCGVTFIARSVDDEGDLSSPVTLDVGVLYSLRPRDDSTARGSSTADDELWTSIVNQAGDVVVFECNGACAHHLGLASGAPPATGNAEIYTDPKDGLVYVAYPSGMGLILARRAADGRWTFRNLSAEAGIGPSDGPVRAVTHLVSTATTGRLVVLVGMDADGRIVGFRQDGSATGGLFNWSLTDISADLDSQGMPTPFFTDLIGYVTPWNAWTLAGIDSVGDIQGVWIVPASFDKWRVDNLSHITGAPPISGQLTVTQTSWSAINLGGVNDDGHLVVTWWVPSFGGRWVTSDLTAMSGGETLVAGRATGFVTPWGAINYAGINGLGEVAAYWWTPATNRWIVSPLTAGFPPGTDRPAGCLTSHVSSIGTMSLLGAADGGEVTRLWWTPHDDNRWKLTDLTGSCIRR